ncbi:MAG: cobalt-precorrin-6A reductase [Alphaproteobacteria bacterium]|nr:cobalt-precorrin-6A reductase [Alphaproteobacteria bacterium]
MTTVLILGGTAEASALAWALQTWPGLRAITSLAGRTRSPEWLPGKTRTGGFGGVDGLTHYLEEQAIDLVIDATHPFAETISHHAALAAERAAIQRLRLTRPLWAKQPGDHWIDAIDAVKAAERLPGLARRVFLTSGHRELEAFAGLDDIWFLIRTIEPVAGPQPRQALCINARGPFDEASERALFEEHRIDALVTKASGGSATYAKIAAARRLGLPVIMIQRPPPPAGPIVHNTDDALTWLRQVTA